jgi:hypothetical protein
MSPIRIKPVLKIDHLSEMARVNFVKFYTVEHDVEIHHVGEVHKDFLERLVEQWNYTLKYGIYQYPSKYLDLKTPVEDGVSEDSETDGSEAEAEDNYVRDDFQSLGCARMCSDMYVPEPVCQSIMRGPTCPQAQLQAGPASTYVSRDPNVVHPEFADTHLISV